MFRLSALLGLGLLTAALVVGVGTSGETKKEKTKGQLPTGWKDIKNLTEAQKAKIRGIDADAKMKIQELEQKMKELRAKARAEQFKILSEDQQAEARKIATGEETSKTKETSPPKDKKKE